MAQIADSHSMSMRGPMVERQSVTVSGLPFQIWFKAVFGFAMLALVLSGAFSAQFGFRMNTGFSVLAPIVGALFGGIVVIILSNSAQRRR